MGLEDSLGNKKNGRFKESYEDFMKGVFKGVLCFMALFYATVGSLSYIAQFNEREERERQRIESFWKGEEGYMTPYDVERTKVKDLGGQGWVRYTISGVGTGGKEVRLMLTVPEGESDEFYRKLEDMLGKETLVYKGNNTKEGIVTSRERITFPEE